MRCIDHCHTVVRVKFLIFYHTAFPAFAELYETVDTYGACVSVALRLYVFSHLSK